VIVEDAGPVGEFCARLDELRIAAGAEVPALARRLSLSRAHLYAILGGRITRPPDWHRVVRPLVDACTGGDPSALAEWRQRHAVLTGVWEELRRRDHPAAPTASAAAGPDEPDEPSGPASAPSPVPRQLPGLAADFTGRAAELATLDGMLEAAGGRRLGTMVISAIGGTAGVGKTALAVHWAHQAASRFPDGQLYVNLHGFDPSASPVAPAEAIRGFLDALAVPAERVPSELSAQAGLYRSLLAHRKTLIVLDNARDEEQVRPLLASGPGCLTIVTSRSQLTGLAATEGARLLTLDVLPHDEACRLLTARLGGGRADDDPATISQIAVLCAHLPLALAIVAAGAAARPLLPVAAVAAELHEAASPLDALDTGEPATSIRAVFSWSYSQLSPAAARMFRLLGVHLGPDISAPAAASLAGTGQPAARRLLAELARAHLITEHAPGRYAFHDLLRAYATDQARATDSDADRHAAIHRVLDHYLHTARAAGDLIDPTRDQIPIHPPRPGVQPEHLADDQQALAWLQAEHQVLLAAVTLASSAPSDVHAWQIPWTIKDFLQRRGQFQQSLAVHRIALAAAARLGEAAGQATFLRHMSLACLSLGDHHQALEHGATALRLCQQTGDRAGEAKVHQFFALVARDQGRYADGFSHDEQALRLYQAVGHRVGESSVLNNLGWARILLGDYEQARVFCRQSLLLTTELGLRQGQGHAWDSLGYVEHHLGQFTEAAACYQRALTIFREVGDLPAQAETLTRLGDTRHAAGDQQQARDAWQKALDILTDLGQAEAETLRDKLRSLALPSSAAGRFRS
jgi:tetratricopeptide (TPR) repeat protein